MFRRMFFLLAAILALASVSIPAEAGWGSCNAAVAAPVQVEAELRWEYHAEWGQSLLFRGPNQIAGWDHAKKVYRTLDDGVWSEPKPAPWLNSACADCMCPCESGDCTCDGCKCPNCAAKKKKVKAESRVADPSPCADGCTCCECEDGCRCGKGKPCGEGCPCLTKSIKPVGSVANPPGAMDLPADVREWFRNPDGSCVQCSIGMCGVDQNVPAAATLLWDTEYGPKERGGSYPSRVAAYCKRRGIMAYNVTGANTWDWMKWAALTGRGAAIGAGGSHFQTLYGYRPSDNHYFVCNNNSPQKVDEYTEDQFRRLHLASGQWVVILDYPPHPERPEYVAWWLDPVKINWSEAKFVSADPQATAMLQAALSDAEAEVKKARPDAGFGHAPESGECVFMSTRYADELMRRGFAEDELLREARRGFGQGVLPEVEKDEVIRRGDMVEHLGGIRDDGLEAFTEAMAPPADDSAKWFVSIITMKGCAPCEKLKADWNKSAELRAFAKPDNPKESWAHFTVYDKDDKSQAFRFPGVVFRGYPTIIIQPPRTGAFGAPKTVVFQATGYDGNARALAQSISTTLRKYVSSLPKRDGAAQREVRPPWQPPPKTPPAPAPGPNIVPELPSIDVPPPDTVKPAPAASNWIAVGAVLVGGFVCFLFVIVVAVLALVLARK